MKSIEQIVDSLTLIFTSPYALEKMYKEIYAENEKTEKEQKKK
ncbi:hypothetical protein ACIG6B_22430 [Bacillus mobilis]|jgi:hypothetical protein|nr:hypothetical protein [Bacillus mobilis]